MEPDNIAARINHRGNDMNALKVLAGVALCATMAACGGGGDDSGSKATPQGESLNGSFTTPTGSVLPDPATTKDPITVTVNTEFTGQTSPNMGAFTVPIKVRQVGTNTVHIASITCTLKTGQPGNGVYQCEGSTTLPTMAPGYYEFGIRLDPASKYTFNGALPDERFGSVDVEANTPS